MAATGNGGGLLTFWADCAAEAVPQIEMHGNSATSRTSAYDHLGPKPVFPISAF